MFRRIGVGLSRRNCRIEPQRNGKRFITAARHSSERSRESQIIRLPGQQLCGTSPGRHPGFVEIPRAPLGHSQRALLIAPGRLRPLGHPKNANSHWRRSFHDWRHSALRGQPAHITHNVDVRFGGVQRDQFGSFFDARGGSINPCRLTPYVVDRGETVKKKLSNNDAIAGCHSATAQPRPRVPVRRLARKPRHFGRISQDHSWLRCAPAAKACSASAEVRSASHGDLPKLHPRPG